MNIYRKSEIPAHLLEWFVPAEIGLEKTPDAFVAKMVEVFREVRRTLRDDGTLWLNLGDSYTTRFYSHGSLRTVGVTDGDWCKTGQRDAHGTYQPPESFNGLKPKDLCMIPWRVALALQADGWWLRSVICWAKKSPMPEGVTDRPTSSWEPIFLLAKSDRYFYDAEAVKEESVDPVGSAKRYAAPFFVGDKHESGGYSADGATHTAGMKTFTGTRNQRNVWHLGPEPYPESHFATFPTEIPRRAIKAGTSERGCCAACGAQLSRLVDRITKKTVGWLPGCECFVDTVPCMVLDPFLGSGTTVAVARELGRHGVGCELNPEYAELARERIGRAEKPTTFRSDREIDSPLFAPRSST